MDNKIALKRIGIFLAFAFGIAWSIALVIYLTGGLANSPALFPGSGITLALVLLALGYMGSPALAHILTRLITREGWQNAMLKPRFKRGWLFWLAAWVLPAVCTITGAAFFYALLPQYFDPQLKTIQELFRLPADFPIDPWLLVVLQTVQAVMISPLINGLFTFGEEFGWRGYLQPRLMPLGGRKTMLLMGVIWGVWHAPIIAMGHNYGLEYPGAPWLGMLAMTWFTLVSGVFLGWVTIRGGSVWPAVIGHAAINGISGLGIAALKGEPNPLLGPFPFGIVASIGWTVVAAWIMLHPRAFNSPEPAPNPPERPA